MFRALNNKPLWVHILLALALVLLLLFLFALSLDWITRHGEINTVPAVTGKRIGEVEKMLESKKFEIVVQDSVYYDSIPPGTILKQVPEADEVVKVNRTVYVTINRFIAPDVELPSLNGLSYKNAEMVLRNIGLRIGDTTYKADFASNTILEAMFKGKPILPGTKIKMGNTIDLVLSSGVGSESMPVPDLFGLTFSEARALLDAQGIIMGSVVPMADVQDRENAFVYKQRPGPRTDDGKRLSLRAGQMMDIWTQIQKPEKDSVNTISTPTNDEEQ